MQVELIGFINDVERIIAACSKATRSKPSSAILAELDIDEARRHIGRVLARGHEGISEFSYFIFSISGVSRVLTHQLVRHRIASYLQMSSREADLSNVDFITPPKISRNAKNLKLFTETVNKARESYSKLVQAGIKLEDARYLLPDSIETHISIAMNGRSLNNLFGLRLCERAQWEIRELATQMRKEVVEIAPALFWSELRPCVRKGLCPEGSETCGFYKGNRFKHERRRYLEGYPNE